ncbi:DMT family transporter [Clostridium sp. C105KSO13]|uniref:DMT family transporter n=1 Tax=Clostridium sp. C105KSO13 TaxID=1776045 RepID=UPI0007405FC5|nr:DMT family transporter [Clostridium sp. C105KSO13]CUX21189.1 putative inner membrane transporter YicL [Clostridium sp. C105KSO13]
MTQDKILKMKGCIFAFLAGALWGITSPVAQFLFDSKGIVAKWLVPYRLLTAGVLLLIYTGLKKQGITKVWKQRKDAFRLVIFGIFGMMGMQYTFFAAVQEMNAGTATIFQYLNPAILIVFYAVVHNVLPSRKETVSVIVAVTGIMIVATHGDFSTLMVLPKGLILGIMLAVITCIYGVLPVPLLKKYSAEAVSAWGMIIGGTVLMLAAQPWKMQVTIDFQVSLAFIVIVVFGTVLPFGFYLISVKYAGPVYAGLFSSIEPIAATVVAAVFLGTTFAKMDIVGFVLVLSTLFILAIPDKTQ